MVENIFDYLKKYRNVSFMDKEFNEIDASICALIPYLDFKDIISEGKEKNSLGESIISFLVTYKKRGFLKQGFWQKNLVKIAKLLQDSQRYSNILVYGYVNRLSSETQFNAVTMILPNGDKVISFKGTDINLVGWKEDFTFAYEFPNKCQKLAIKYIKEHTSIFDKNIIVLGHSKGGHLALVASMYSNYIIRKKIKNIYSFDGPGLRKQEFTSKRYERIEDKLIHIVPEHSIIGLFLSNKDNYDVVKASCKDLSCHSIFTWELKDDRFYRTKLSSLSLNLKQSIVLWLNGRSIDNVSKTVNDIFDYLEHNNVNTVIDLKKLKTLLTLFKKRKEIDEETRRVISNFIKFNYDFQKLRTDEIELV